MPTTSAPPRYLSTREAAAELAVTPRTIRRAVARGIVPAVRLGPRGRLRIPQAALAALLQPRRSEETA